MYVSKFEPPKSNERFIVHGQADYYEEYETKYGYVSKRRLFEVTCVACGARRDMRKDCIERNKSCGCVKPIRISRKGSHKLYDGKTLEQWSKECGISASCLYQRMRRKNLTVHQAIELGANLKENTTTNKSVSK